MFANNSGDDLNGQVTWYRPTVAPAKVYPQGFTYQTTFVGSQYVRPAAGERALDLSDAMVLFSGGDSNYSLTDEITIAPNNRVTNLGDTKMTLAFSPGNGLFHGAVLPPDARHGTAYSGVVFQKQNTGNGYFLGGSQTGYVFIGPNQ